MDTETLLAERERTHGKYDEFATLVRSLKYDVSLSTRKNEWSLSPEHAEAIDMILHKIGRIVTGDPNIKDHWDDIAGYATLGARFVRPREQSTSSSTS